VQNNSFLYLIEKAENLRHSMCLQNQAQSEQKGKIWGMEGLKIKIFDLDTEVVLETLEYILFFQKNSVTIWANW